MGWDSCSTWETKKDVQNNLRRDISRNATILAEKSTSEGIWYVVEKQGFGKFIYFALVKKSGRSYFVKTMTEDMGPCYYSCPVQFFEIADQPKEKYAIEWRQKVLQQSLVPKKRFSIGMKLRIYDNDFIIENKVKNTFIGVQLESGRRYRLSRKNLKDAEILG